MITAFAFAAGSVIAGVGAIIAVYVVAEAIRNRVYSRRYEHTINRMIELERR